MIDSWQLATYRKKIWGLRWRGMGRDYGRNRAVKRTQRLWERRSEENRENSRT